MEIEDFINQQKEFDNKHKSHFNWDVKINDTNIEILEYLLICLVGEFGELSNLIKKVVRGDFKLKEIKEDLSEEVVDIFIYVIKLSYQLDIDIEKNFKKKMNMNKLRFEKYEKESE